MNRRTVLVATILVLGAGVLVMLVVLTHSPYPARSLPDGSHLSVAFVGYTNRLSHTHYRGTRHQRILNNVIPAKWRQRLGLQNPGSSGFQFGNT
ncbi:MAG TPA: hypothetical protein VJW76_09985, partial [Verrucomicrobiae bacterium]|nr:hypothetical protein [Verrucomicrobiae bacterium]